MAKILVVEDDVATSLAIKEWLESEKHKVDVVNSGDEALDYLKAFEYDLLLLDRQLPGLSGIEICKLYKSKTSRPVLMLTSMSSIEHKVQGLESGADDYLTKPFDVRELIARVKALLRRSTDNQILDKVTIRDITVDTGSRIVKRNEKTIELTPREYELLEFFVKHPNQIISQEALLKRVWHSDADASPQAVYTCLNRLRKHLDASDKEYLIKTVHGVGYRLEV